jgi:DNA adenine methylase
MVAKLLKYVPKHTYYLEAFGGGASLLFAKKPTTFEVYNDILSDLVNFFRVLQDPEKFQKFYEKVYLTPYSRELYYIFRNEYESIEDEVEKAYRFFVIARQSFSGKWGESWGYNVKEIRKNMCENIAAWLSTIEMLPEMHARLRTVVIEHDTWEKVCERYNDWGDEGFYYLDPPYVLDTRRDKKGYKYEMSNEEHKKLVDWLLTKAKVKVMLSGYDNEIYQKLEKNGWKKICWEVACSAAGRTRGTGILGKGATFAKNQRRVECIWINYDPESHEIRNRNTNALFS